MTGALAVGCVVLGVALLLAGKDQGPATAPISTELPTIALPVTNPGAPTRAEEMLERRIPDLDLRFITFKEAIDKIGYLSGANIAVRWKSLEAAQVQRDSKIHLHVWNVSVRTALRLVLNMVDDGGDCGFEPTGDVIVVAHRVALQPYAIVTAYNVRDILKAVHDPSAAPDAAGDSIVKVIEDSIAPDTWMNNGGTDGSIADLGGILVIRQTSDNHRKIAALLEEIRQGTRRVPTTRAISADER